MLEGKNIVITGSNRGIGLAITEKCAEYGANIFACMRDLSAENINKAGSISDKYGVKVSVIQLDLSNTESINKASDQIISQKVRIDVLVNNAGTSGNDRVFSMTTLDEIRHTFDINFFGPMLLTQKLLKNMIRNKAGSIINISSVSVFDGRPAQFGYITSKAAIMGASRRLAEELGVFNIRVNTIAPGVTKTDMLERMSSNALNKAIDNSFLKRPAQPEDIAEVVAFLASDKSCYITGQTICIDGGGN